MVCSKNKVIREQAVDILASQTQNAYVEKAENSFKPSKSDKDN